MKKTIKNIIEYCLYSIYFLMNLICFRKGKRIIFISYPDATDNSWYLYKHALTRLQGYEIVWLVSKVSPRIKDKILKCNQGLNKNTVTVIKKWSVRGLQKFICSEIVFHTHGTYFFVKAVINSPIIVNLWHGMPIKAISALDGRTGSDICYSHYSIATSDPYRDIISRAFNLPIEKVLATGLPRNDVLYTGVATEKRKDILKSFSNNEEMNIVIWLPTYRVSFYGDIRVDGNKDSFIDDLDADFLYVTNQLFSDANLTLVIKLHPLDSMNLSSSDYNFSNIKFYDSMKWQENGSELYDVISISKGLISDFSSVMIDCLPTRIPVGFIKSSQDNYSRKIVIPIANLEKCVTTIEKPEDIISMVNSTHRIQSDAEISDRVNYFNSYGSNASDKIFNKFFLN